MGRPARARTGSDGAMAATALGSGSAASERGAEGPKVIPLERGGAPDRASPRRRRRERRSSELPSPSGPDARIGQVLSGTYRIERLIAVGGMGAVYEVAHTRLSQRFAVKFLDQVLSGDAEVYARFRQEAEIAAQLDHDNVVQVVDFDTDEAGSPYMVMELVSGETLDAHIHRHGPLERDELLALFEPLCRALDACHARGIVHRDLKPSNIVVRARGDGRFDLKLLDFGISKIKQEGPRDMTRDNVVMGTPNYMSPEQASGNNRDVDARADIFALGAILYEMISGQKAFDAEGLPQLLHQIVYDAPTPIGEHGAPPRVAEVVDRALAKAPEDRFERAGDLIEALERAYGGRVERIAAGASLPTRSTAMATGAWLVALVLSSGVVGLGTFLVTASPAPASAEPSASPEPRGDALAREPESPVRGGPEPEGFDTAVAEVATARLVEAQGRLYRADRSRLIYWSDPQSEARSMVLPSAASVTALALSSDRREVLVGQADGWVTRVDHALKLDGERRRLGEGAITALAAGAGYLAVGEGRRLRLLSSKTQKTLRSFDGEVPVDAALFTPGQEPVLFVFRGDELELVDADRRRVVARVPLGRPVAKVGLAEASLEDASLLWIDQVQGDWIVRRTFRVVRTTRRQAPRLEQVGLERLAG